MTVTFFKRKKRYVKLTSKLVVADKKILLFNDKYDTYAIKLKLKRKKIDPEHFCIACRTLTRSVIVGVMGCCLWYSAVGGNKFANLGGQIGRATILGTVCATLPGCAHGSEVVGTALGDALLCRLRYRDDARGKRYWTIYFVEEEMLRRYCI